MSSHFASESSDGSRCCSAYMHLELAVLPWDRRQGLGLSCGALHFNKYNKHLGHYD